MEAYETKNCNTLRKIMANYINYVNTTKRIVQRPHLINLPQILPLSTNVYLKSIL